MDHATEQAEKLRYEGRLHAVESLRLKYRSVVHRINNLAAGIRMANTDAEFAEMVGRHLTQIAGRLDWMDLPTGQLVSRSTQAQAAGGLPALLGVITRLADTIAATPYISA